MRSTLLLLFCQLEVYWRFLRFVPSHIRRVSPVWSTNTAATFSETLEPWAWTKVILQPAIPLWSSRGLNLGWFSPANGITPLDIAVKRPYCGFDLFMFIEKSPKVLRERTKSIFGPNQTSWRLIESAHVGLDPSLRIHGVPIALELGPWGSKTSHTFPFWGSIILASQRWGQELAYPRRAQSVGYSHWSNGVGSAMSLLASTHKGWLPTCPLSAVQWMHFTATKTALRALTAFYASVLHDDDDDEVLSSLWLKTCLAQPNRLTSIGTFEPDDEMLTLTEDDKGRTSLTLLDKFIMDNGEESLSNISFFEAEERARYQSLQHFVPLIDYIGLSFGGNINEALEKQSADYICTVTAEVVTHILATRLKQQLSSSTLNTASTSQIIVLHLLWLEFFELILNGG